MELSGSNRLRRLGESPALIGAVKLLRELLPGDAGYGDPLSTAGETQAGLIGRRLSEATAERPTVLREAGLSALQVWEAIAQARGSGGAERAVAILFTDLAGFSDWALKAGDEPAIELLREVSIVVEPAVKARDGEVVKRLGDGMMAVFDDPRGALESVLAARDDLAEIEVEGYEPKLRAGIHAGRARIVGGDYFGVDVNVAARVAEHAAGDELLLTDAALAQLDEGGLDVRRKRFFRAKGVPGEVRVHTVSPK
jgi:adenylate cyclase